MPPGDKRGTDRPAPRRKAWTWKVEDEQTNRDLGLLYEPGNWGDVLKGTWAVLLARALARQRAGAPLRYLDPFAGAATYPLTPAAAERLAWLDSGLFARAQAAWVRRGELASTALLVQQEAALLGVEARLEVFDSDPRRLDTWNAVSGARPLRLESGEQALGDSDADLILVDPYDLFDRWTDILPGAVKAARVSRVLLYLYNKSLRGEGYRRSYRSFRARLESLAPGEVLIGRTPSDIFLPRAFHEVLLLGPGRPPGDLRRDLLRSAKALACRMSTAGAVEVRAPREDRRSTEEDER